MAYWLFKSEPDVYGIDDLRKEKITCWNGVRNYQARNFMLTMQVGDEGFFYHSNTAFPGIVGLVEVVRAAYPDHTALDPTSKYHDPKATADKPIWQMVDIAFRTRFDRVLTLDELRATAGLGEMLILRRGNRLSVTPVTPAEWQIITQLIGFGPAADAPLQKEAERR